MCYICETDLLGQLCLAMLSWATLAILVYSLYIFYLWLLATTSFPFDTVTWKYSLIWQRLSPSLWVAEARIYCCFVIWRADDTMVWYACQLKLLFSFQHQMKCHLMLKWKEESNKRGQCNRKMNSMINSQYYTSVTLLISFKCC